MSFAEEVERWAEKARQREEAVFIGVVDAVYESVVNGSSVTGAPGQPQATGDLKGSWEQAIVGKIGLVVTNHPGAQAIEHGTRRGRALVLHGTGGGFHSVALTRDNFVPLVAAVVREVAPDGP